MQTGLDVWSGSILIFELCTVVTGHQYHIKWQSHPKILSEHTFWTSPHVVLKQGGDRSDPCKLVNPSCRITSSIVDRDIVFLIVNRFNHDDGLAMLRRLEEGQSGSKGVIGEG